MDYDWLEHGNDYDVRLMLGQASTDAVNQVSRLAYGEATGITQTVRNYAASLGIAVLGTVLVYQLRSHVTVYVIDPGLGGRIFASTDGRHFSARPSPCSAAQKAGLVQAVATSGTRLAVLCVSNPSISDATKTVYRSANTGRTYSPAGTTQRFGISAELAASSSGRLLVAAWSNGSWMYLNSGHKKHWQMVLGLGDGGAGFGDLAFVTPTVAWAVYGPVNLFPADFGSLYVTRDGGAHWQLITL